MQVGKPDNKMQSKREIKVQGERKGSLQPIPNFNLLSAWSFRFSAALTNHISLFSPERARARAFYEPEKEIPFVSQHISFAWHG